MPPLSALSVINCTVVSRFLFAAVLLAAAPAAAQSRYFAGIDDLPLAPGLVERAGGAGFAGAEGRVVVAVAQGPAAPASVLAFYIETLPALGWGFSPGGEDLEFRRGRERLALAIAPADGGARVEVRLFSAPAPQE
mgnify:CR=1 FL=1